MTSITAAEPAEAGCRREDLLHCGISELCHDLGPQRASSNSQPGLALYTFSSPETNHTQTYTQNPCLTHICILFCIYLTVN